MKGIEGLQFRPLVKKDVETVLKTWIGTYRNSPYAGCIPNNRFDEITGDCINQLFRRGAIGLGIVSQDNPDHLLGYIVTEQTRMGEPVVHYVFVRDLYRRHGLSKALMATAGITPDDQFIYTHRTPCASWYGRRARHIPAVARRKDQ